MTESGAPGSGNVIVSVAAALPFSIPCQAHNLKAAGSNPAPATKIFLNDSNCIDRSNPDCPQTLHTIEGPNRAQH